MPDMDSNTLDPCAPVAAVMDESIVTDRPGVLVMGGDTTEIIARYVLASGATWVWVEGFSQAGKSSFASRLAHALEWKHVHLDSFTHGRSVDSSRFADHLDHNR